MQYFASFEPFEIFDEFNGVQGTYIKSFLISDKINLNDWQATHEANLSNLDTFLGRPGIHYINPENGKRDHTGSTTFEKSLQIQELYRVASIIAVGSDIPTRKNWQVSKMVDDSITEKIRSKEIKWISPSIWPDEDAVEIKDPDDLSVIVLTLTSADFIFTSPNVIWTPTDAHTALLPKSHYVCFIHLINEATPIETISKHFLTIEKS